MKRFYGERKENGAIMVMAALILTAVIGFTALAVDLGLYHYKGAKLQNAVDAAATAVAGNLGTIDTSLEEVAYQYLAENGFDREAYGKDSNQKNNLQVKIERKGEVNLKSADDERYINAGYYKLTVSTNESTLFGNIFNISSLKLEKYSYVKAEANYVPKPRALNYTIFAGSTSGTASNPAIAINGRTSQLLNWGSYFTEKGINFINSNVVQPIIGFFGGTPNYGELVHINLSEVVSNGDVHSNSNIGVGVQALNVSRIKDRDFEGENNVETYNELEPEENEFLRGFNDYGQVTFTAVKDIRFNYLQGTGLLNGGYVDGQTRIYVPNQQYIEQTQVALNVIDLLDFSQIDSTATLRTEYSDAAEVYLSKQVAFSDERLAEQRDMILAQKDNLDYVGPNQYTLSNQGSIVYYIHAGAANEMLDYAEEKGTDGLLSDLAESGNDQMYNSVEENGKSVESPSAGTVYDTSVDKDGTTTSNYTFTKKNKVGEITQSASLSVTGNSVARNFGALTNPPARTLTGARFATSQTFQENSEYIEIPNLKPYFSRQINRSIRNATKSRELINTSDAGQKNIKAAVKSKNDELIGLTKNLSFEDTKYADSSTYDSFDNTVLFKTYKANPSSGITNLNSSVINYTGQSQDTDKHTAYTYNVSMSDRTYKGYSLYDSNNKLKKPSEFISEKKALYDTEYGQKAILDKYNTITDNGNNTDKNEKKKVERTKADLLAKNEFKYSYEKNDSNNNNSVKKRIESIGFPNITNPDLVVPGASSRISVTAPDPKGVFLVKDDISYQPTKDYDDATKDDYAIIDNLATNISANEKTVTLSGGLTWPDGSTGSKSVSGQTSATNWQDLSDTYFSNGTNYKSDKSEYVKSGKYAFVGTSSNHKDLKSTKQNLDIGQEGSYSALVVTGNIEVKKQLQIRDYCVVYCLGNVTCAQLVMEDGARLYCAGTLSVSGKNTSFPSEAKVYAGSINYSATGKHDSDFNYTMVSTGNITFADRFVNWGVVKCKGTLTIDSGEDWKGLVNYGKIYIYGNLTSQEMIRMEGTGDCWLYVCGNVTCSNLTSDTGWDDNKASNAFHMMNSSKAYIGGTLTSNATGRDRRIWIEENDSSNNDAVLSVYGKSGSTITEATSGMTVIHFAADDGNVYFGPGGFSTKDNVKGYFINEGNFYSFGTANIKTKDTNNQLLNNGVTYIRGNLNVTRKDLIVSNDHTLYVADNDTNPKNTTGGVLSAVNLTLNNTAKVHADVAVNVSGTLTLNGTGTIIEGDFGGVNYGTLGTNNGTINPPVSFAASKIDFSGIEEYLYVPVGGSAAYESFKLIHSRVKIDGDVTINGNLDLTATGYNSACELYITGNLTVTGTITLGYTKLYVEGDISAGNVVANDYSVLLARNRNGVNQVWDFENLVSDLSVKNNITADSHSKVYVEGAVSAKSVKATDSSEVLGFKALNITANWTGSNDTPSDGYMYCDGGSEIFCGTDSNITNEIGIHVINGILYYPESTLTTLHFFVGTSGKVVFDGSLNSKDLTVKQYALVAANGTFFNRGLTKIEGCRFTNNGMMYLVGGVDTSSADTSSSTQDFILGDNSITYLGKTSSDNDSTLTYKGYYEGRGTVYIENNLNITGNTGSVKVGNRNTSIYIPNGTTYVQGGVTASDGNGITISKNCGLIMNDDFTIGCTIYNSGTLHVIDGSLIVHNSAFYITDKDLHNTAVFNNDEIWEYNYQGVSLRNGDTEKDNSADFFVGGTSPVTFVGYVRNYGNIYINAPLDVRGYGSIDGMTGDMAFVNYVGAQAHFNGSVKLNQNQLFNKWKNGDKECIFACEGNLTYGGCLTNCGMLFADGNITNNEPTPTIKGHDGKVRKNKYTNDSHFSLLNGFYKVDNQLKDNLPSRMYREASVYCGGALQVGKTEDNGSDGGEAGSIMSAGSMFVEKDLTIYTNGTRYENKNPLVFWQNLASAYFRTGLWLFNNSNTFVGGDTFVGAGCAFAHDTIFMTEGSLVTKRATKFNVEMRMDWFPLLGEGSCYMTFTRDNTNYNNGNRYNSCYVYVGGDAFINTLGSTIISRTWGSVLGFGRWPDNNARDTFIYANTNMYVGGSMYCSSKLDIRENSNIMVAGKKNVEVNGVEKKLGFYDKNGNLKNPVLYNFEIGLIDNKCTPIDATTRLRTRTYLTAAENRNCKFFVYQALDMSPCSKLIVNGGGHVEDTVKIRDMTKTYFYGNFEGKEYVEIGKALDGVDETEAKEAGFIQPGDSLAEYEFSNSAYMYVGGNYESGNLNGVVGGILQWLKNQFVSTGYTKVFASSTLKVKGTVVSNRYITLRHDARIYAGGNLTAATSIDGGNYSEFYVGGDMNAGTSTITKIIDTADILDISSRGCIDLREQCQCIVGGNMFSTKHIQIGELAVGSYTRGRKTNYAVKSVSEGNENAYESPDDEDTTETECPLCGEPLTDDEIQNRHCDDCNKDIDISAGGDADGTSQGVSDAITLDTSTELDNENLCPHCSKPLGRVELKKSHCYDCNQDFVLNCAYGANVFIQGSLIALNGHFKEFEYSSVMVGKYVFAPDYITLRSNADLWVLPEMFGNDTYKYLPFIGTNPTTLWGIIKEWFAEKFYEFKETYKPKEGSVYTFGDFTANYNSSVLGTYDCYIPGKLIMRYDSLLYFGHDVSCYASTAVSAINGAVGNLANLFRTEKQRETYTGFDAVGEAGPGYRYTCKNTAKHNGYYYNMTTRDDDAVPVGGKIKCDVCGQEVDINTKKKVQVSYPAVIYAFNDINIATTVDMQMTYLVADRGNVNLTNIYTATNWNETNLKELPNAIASYKGNINYFAMYGKLASLFYAPSQNIDFDGYYSEIWGCVLGDTVTMNAYYQGFHRFNNWRTMDLQIAESGSVYLIPEKDYLKAPDNVDDDNYINNNVTDPVQLFFSTCPNCNKAHSDNNEDGVCDYCGYDYNELTTFGAP